MPRQVNSSLPPPHPASGVSIAAESNPPPDQALTLLVRELATAHAELRALRAQINGNAEEPAAGGKKAQPLPEAFLRFDELPDGALVDMKVVSLLDHCSLATTWRRLRAGLLGEPVYVGGTTRLRVGTLRELRAARAAPADRREHGISIGPLRATSAAAAKAKDNGSAETAVQVDRAVQQPELGTRPKRLRRAADASPVETS